MREGVTVYLDIPLDVLARRIAAEGTDSRPILDSESGDAYTKVVVNSVTQFHRSKIFKPLSRRNKHLVIGFDVLFNFFTGFHGFAFSFEKESASICKGGCKGFPATYVL